MIECFASQERNDFRKTFLGNCERFPFVGRNRLFLINQMERNGPYENFVRKGMYSSFLVFAVCSITLVPCILLDEISGFFMGKIVLLHLAENSHRVFRTNGKRPLSNGASSSLSILFVEKSRTTI